MDVLERIKRLVARGRYRFTVKASLELRQDGLEPADAVEAILNARTIKKTLRSRSSLRARSGEKLHVMESFNFGGSFVYTKGKIT